MKIKQTFFCILGAALAVASLIGCKVTEPRGTVFANTQLTRDDEEIIFAYSFNYKTGLYGLSTKTAIVREIVRPQVGSLSDPCLAQDGKTVLCIYTEPVNGKSRYYVTSVSLQDTAFIKLFEAPLPIFSLAVAKRAQKLYFLAAGDIGHSSPLVRAGPRLMELYSASLDGTNFQQESTFGAYTIWGKLALDAQEEFVYLCINFLTHTRPDTRPDGPYKYRVATKELVYLIPQNFNALHPEIGKSAYKKQLLNGFLEPAPRKTGTDFFLVGSNNLYAVNGSSLSGAIIYKQSNDDFYKYGYSLVGLATANQEDKAIIYRRGTASGNFFIIDAKGGGTELPLDMQPFLERFK